MLQRCSGGRSAVASLRRWPRAAARRAFRQRAGTRRAGAATALVVCGLVLGACLPHRPPPTPAPAPQQAPEPALPSLPRSVATEFRDLHAVTALLSEGDGVWLGTAGGGLLQVAAPGEAPLRWFGLDHGLPSLRVTALARRGPEEIFVGTDAGLVAVRGDEVKAVPGPPLAAGGVQALLRDRDGRVWVGHAGGLQRVGPEGEAQTVLSGADVLDLASDGAGDVWAGTRAAGVLHIAGDFAERFEQHHGLATQGAARIITTPGGEVIALAPLEQGRDRFSIYDGLRWRGVQVSQPNARWQILDVAQVGEEIEFLTNFGPRRLARLRLPQDPVQRQRTLARRSELWPRLERLTPPQAPAVVPQPPGAVAAAPAVDEGLPPLHLRDLGPGETRRRGEEAAFEAAKAAREQYFRRRTELGALKAELQELSSRRESAQEQVDAGERRLADLRVRAAPAAELRAVEAEIDGARGRLRAAGVGYELGLARSRPLEEQLAALRTAEEQARTAYWERMGGPVLPPSPVAPPPPDPLQPKPAALPGPDDAPPILVLLPSSLELPLPPGRISAWRAEGGALWLGSRDAGAWRLRGRERSAYFAGDLLPGPGPSGPLLDGEGSLWLLNRRGLLLRYDGLAWQTVALPPAWPQAGDARVRPVGVALDAAGRLGLLGQRGRGELHFARRSHEVWEAQGTQRVVPEALDLVVADWALDADGKRWLVLERRDGQGDLRGIGVLALDPRQGDALFYGPEGAEALPGSTLGPRLPSGNVTALTVQGSVVWIASRSGLLRIDAQGARSYDENGGMDSESVSALVAGAAGVAWIRTSEGLAWLDGERWRFLRGRRALPDATAEGALALAPDGTLWAASGAALWRRVGEEWREAVPAAALDGQTVRRVLFPGSGGPWLVLDDRLLQVREP